MPKDHSLSKLGIVFGLEKVIGNTDDTTLLWLGNWIVAQELDSELEFDLQDTMGWYMDWIIDLNQYWKRLTYFIWCSNNFGILLALLLKKNRHLRY